MQELTGTWALVRSESSTADGSQMPAPYGGEDALGIVQLTAAGRMICVLCNSAPELPADTPREFVSYCGAYSFDGKVMRTIVDASSRPDWFNTEQLRDVSFEGETLVLRPPLRAYAAQPEQRVLYWKKIA